MHMRHTGEPQKARASLFLSFSEPWDPRRVPITLQGIDLPTGLFLVDINSLSREGLHPMGFLIAHDKLEIPPREGHLISI